MLRTWSYLFNTFLANTEDSSVKMLLIANDHESKLSGEKSDPFIERLFLRFNPEALKYRDLFSKKDSVSGISKGKTIIFTGLLNDLADKWIKAWEGKVFYHFPEGTPEATMIFPQKKAPFQSSRYEVRVSAVKTLSDTLAGFPALKDLQTDVKNRYDELIAARDLQQQQIGLLDKYKTEIEAQRKVLARLLYQNLGAMMEEYSHEPTLAERFFDLSLLRKPKPDSEASVSRKGTIEAGATIEVAISSKFEVAAGTVCSFSNLSNKAVLWYYFAESASVGDSALKAIVEPLETQETTASEVGWSPSVKVLLVKNTGTIAAEYECELKMPVVVEKTKAAI